MLLMSFLHVSVQTDLQKVLSTGATEIAHKPKPRIWHYPLVAFLTLPKMKTTATRSLRRLRLPSPKRMSFKRTNATQSPDKSTACTEPKMKLLAFGCLLVSLPTILIPSSIKLLVLACSNETLLVSATLKVASSFRSRRLHFVRRPSSTAPKIDTTHSLVLSVMYSLLALEMVENTLRICESLKVSLPSASNARWFRQSTSRGHRWH